MITLKGGHKTTDRRLDRLPQFDERSRNYPVRRLVGTKPIRSYTWSLPTYLDQGHQGACVGYSLRHKLAARYPIWPNATDLEAKAIYKRAQFLDEWPGENYEGTSVLAGLKALIEQGRIAGYDWAFTLQDALLAIVYQGGGVIGVNWYSGMFNTDANGFIRVTGNIAGGHAIFVRGGRFYAVTGAPSDWRNRANWIDYVDKIKSFVILANSWGKGWGVNGDCKLNVAGFERLLKEQGEFGAIRRK